MADKIKEQVNLEEQINLELESRVLGINRYEKKKKNNEKKKREVRRQPQIMLSI